MRRHKNRWVSFLVKKVSLLWVLSPTHYSMILERCMDPVISFFYDSCGEKNLCWWMSQIRDDGRKGKPMSNKSRSQWYMCFWSRSCKEWSCGWICTFFIIYKVQPLYLFFFFCYLLLYTKQKMYLVMSIFINKIRVFYSVTFSYSCV